MNCGPSATDSHNENLIRVISNNSSPVQDINTQINLESLQHDSQEPLEFELATKEINDKLQTDMEMCNHKSDEAVEDQCALGHDMRECDPVYDGHYAMSYYNDLWGGLTCIRADCPNAGLSFGEMIKKKVKVHYCKLCENYEGSKRCNHVICDLCKTKDEDSMGGNRRSRRTRN